MENQLSADIKKASFDLGEALSNSGLSISQQDLHLRYTQFVNTHPGMPRENMVGKTDQDWLNPISESITKA